MSRKLQPCGTTAAYSRHLKNNEPTCEPCRSAHKEAVGIRRKRDLHGGYWPPEGQRCELCGTTGPVVVHHFHGCCQRRHGGGHGTCGRCFIGYLCGHCNRGLGHFMDDPDLLRLAADWQEEALRKMALR